LLTAAQAVPLDEVEQARADLLRAHLAFITNRGSDAPPLLLRAARRLEPIDARLARGAYLEALSAATFAGRLAHPDGTLAKVARAAGAAPRPTRDPSAPDLLLDGLAAHFNQGYAAGVPILRSALEIFGVGMSTDEELRWLWLAHGSAMHLWDEDWERFADRFVRLAREVGWFSELPLALTAQAFRWCSRASWPTRPCWWTRWPRRPRRRAATSRRTPLLRWRRTAATSPRRPR
jgi:hypothetical protein